MMSGVMPYMVGVVLALYRPDIISWIDLRVVNVVWDLN